MTMSMAVAEQRTRSTAGPSNDMLSGEDGDDVIDGGAGNDHIMGGTGADALLPARGTTP